MEDSPMSNEIFIRSSISDKYSVVFSDTVSETLQNIGNTGDVIYIIDALVYKLHIQGKFDNIVLDNFILVESLETSKTIDYVSLVLEKLLNKKIKRDKSLVAIGGGVVQDITAFIASILFRGINWYFIPTTLLAQCDSCIGSKSSINFQGYKNLLGTFKPPKKILVCPVFLNTLDEVEIKSGVGEMFHYFLTVGITDAEEISKEYVHVLRDRSLLLKYIYRSLEIKKAIIEVDEFDTGIRHIFNYGHTFGHAIESFTNYDICHGQAVTIGIDMANFISYKTGLIAKEDFIKIHNLIAFNIPDFVLTNLNIDKYIDILKMDKKNIGNQLGCILAVDLGRVEKKFINFDRHLKELILNYFNCASF